MMSLVRPHMSNHLAVSGLTTSLETSIRRFLQQSKERPDTPPPNDGKIRMCKVGQKNALGTGYKVNKNTKGARNVISKVISKCSKCQNHVCGKRMYLVCRICKEMK